MPGLQRKGQCNGWDGSRQEPGWYRGTPPLEPAMSARGTRRERLEGGEGLVVHGEVPLGVGHLQVTGAGGPGGRAGQEQAQQRQKTEQ